MTGMVDLVNASAPRPPAAEAEYGTHRAVALLFDVAAHGGAQARALGAAVAEGQLAELTDVRPRAFISVAGAGEAMAAADLFAASCGAQWDVPTVRSDRLPSWAGALDVLLVTGSDPGDPWLVEAVATAVRRGVATVVSAPLEGPLAAAAGGRAVNLAPRLAGASSFGFMQALAAHVAVGKAVASSRGAAFPDLSTLADQIDEEIYLAHPSRALFENPARALAARMRGRRVVLAGDGPAAVAVARYGADALLRVAGEPAAATDLATALMAADQLASGALSGTAALFHDPELDGPLSAAPRVFALTTVAGLERTSARIRRFSDAETVVADNAGGSELPELAVLAQRLALASAYLRADGED